MKIFKSQKGVTLLEIILVLVIGSTLILLSLNTYQSMQSEKDIEALQYNVDTLFLGMGSYYHANCGIVTKPNPSPGPSTVPVTGALVTTTTPQDISMAALSPYLPSQWIGTITTTTPGPVTTPPTPPTITTSTGTVPPFNPLVDDTGTTSPGYVMQFNLTTGPVVAICSAKDCGSKQSIAVPSPMAALTMRAQVAILIQDAQQVQALAGQLSADCISSWNGTDVDTCESNPTAGNYLVWERLPSLAAPVTSSSLWMSMPVLKQFNLQYTHDQMFEINQNTYIDNGVSGSAQQYYTCGS